MKYLKYIFLAVLGLCLVTVAMANRGAVELKLVPAALSGPLGFQERVSLPLFIVIFGAILFGILIGFVWEWLREHRYRREAELRRREAARLQHENRELRQEQTGDDVLAMLEAPPARRA